VIIYISQMEKTEFWFRLPLWFSQHLYNIFLAYVQSCLLREISIISMPTLLSR
jgi:hypothetical protein